MRRLALIVALTLVVAACGDDDAVTTMSPDATTAATEAPTTSVVATMPPATAPPTTAPSAGAFTGEDLVVAVLEDGDPWAVPVTGTHRISLSLDDIWPLDSDITDFSDERAVYESGGFLEGSFNFFAEPDGNSVILTGAHLFETAAGAEAALDVIEASFSDTSLVEAITGLDSGALTAVEPMEPGSIGDRVDRAAAVRLTGPDVQVVGVIWISDNMLQFVRAGMVLGDEERQAATFAVAEFMAARISG